MSTSTSKANRRTDSSANTARAVSRSNALSPHCVSGNVVSPINRTSRLNSLPASWERKKDAPIALMRNASLGAPRRRSGR